MKITRGILLAGCLAAVGGSLLSPPTEASEKEKLKLLIIDGQNNHNWRATTPVLKSFLTKSERFAVGVATTPTKKNAPQDEWDKFRPNFSDYDVVLSNYNGELWPEPVQRNLKHTWPAAGRW